MDNLPLIEPTLEHIIRPHRCARKDGWPLRDFSLCSPGYIAVFRYKEDPNPSSFVGVYSTVQDSDSKGEPRLLYQKEFEDEDSGWVGISFMDSDYTEIVTYGCNKVQVRDYKLTKVLRSCNVNGNIRCLSVSGNDIFIALLSNTVNIYDKELNEKESIGLGGVYECPLDMAAAADRLYLRTLQERAIVYNRKSGSKEIEYNAGNDAQTCTYSVTVNVEIGVVAVLWDIILRGKSKRQVAVYSFICNNCFAVFDVESGVFRIRISDQGIIATGDETTGEVKIYDLLTYDFLKIAWAASLWKDDCKKLTDHFGVSKDQSDSILQSDTPAEDLLSVFEKMKIIGVSDVFSLMKAFMALEMNGIFYGAAARYSKKANHP